MGRIPKPSKSSVSNIPSPNKASFLATQDGITFSFEIFEKTEYFNLDGTCNNWPSEMLDMMKEVSKHNNTELKMGQIRTYRVHNHERAHCPSPLPEGVELRDCYQIRISKSKGGIHGIFRENVFYVIWLDPLHNMYPDDRFGGLRKIKAPSTCCKDREDEIIRLQKRIQQLEDENSIYRELFEKA